jgi:hypothetical protein
MTNTNEINKNMMDIYFIRIAVKRLFVRNLKGLYIYVIPMRPINAKIDIKSVALRAENIFVFFSLLS